MECFFLYVRLSVCDYVCVRVCVFCIEENFEILLLYLVITTLLILILYSSLGACKNFPKMIRYLNYLLPIRKFTHFIKHL